VRAEPMAMSCALPASVPTNRSSDAIWSVKKSSSRPWDRRDDVPGRATVVGTDEFGG